MTAVALTILGGLLLALVKYWGRQQDQRDQVSQAWLTERRRMREL